MARKFLTPIDLSKLEIQNVALQNLSSDPGTPATGQIYFNTGGSVKVYNGSSWLSLSTTSGTVTSVTGTSPVVSSGGTTPAISLASGYGDTLNPYASKSANTVLVAPNGSSGVPTFRSLAAADIPSTLAATTFSGAIAMGNNRITGLGDPSGAQDAATKAYVDNVAVGVNAHDAVRAVLTSTLAGTYTAGTTTANPPGDGGTGLNAYITYTATGAQTVDGQTLALNDRVLVQSGVTAATGTSSIANGIYVVQSDGIGGQSTISGFSSGSATKVVLVRALDADNTIFGDVAAGDLVFVTSGNNYSNTQWIQTNKGTATSGSKYSVLIGTDGISFTQFSGASSTTAGAGLVVNGNAFDVGTASTARIVVNADNIDLATVSQTNTTTSTSATSFVSAHTVDSYGRVTGTVSGAVPFTALGTSTSTATATAAAGTITSARRVTGAGIGTGTSMVVNHGLGQWVTAQMFDSSGNLVDVDVVNAATNGGTTTFTFAASQTLTGYQYVIVG